MTLIVRLLTWNDLAGAGFGIIANLLLLYLVITVNKNKMEKMTKTLLQNCFLDLFLSSTTLFAGIQVAVINGVCYLIIGSPFHVLGFKAASIILCTYGSSLILSIQAMPVPFYIRYVIICRGQEVTNKHVIIPYAIVFSCYLLIYGLLFWSYPPVADHYDEFIPATLTEFWTSEFPKGPVFVAAKTQSLSLLLPLGVIFITTFTSYVLVIIFSIKITYQLHTHASLYPSTKVLHKQLNLTLIIQALGPFLTGNLPVICLLAMIGFNIESPYPLLCCSFLLGWVSGVSPVAAIVIIAPYRKRVKELLRMTSISRESKTPVVSDKKRQNNWCQ